MDNQKQEIYNMLDSLTQIEIEEYIQKRNIKSTYTEELLRKIQASKPMTNYCKITKSIGQDIEDSLLKYLRLGQAWSLAIILTQFCNEKCEIKDIKSFINMLLDNDKVLKEYTYDLMKDF